MFIFKKKYFLIIDEVNNITSEIEQVISQITSENTSDNSSSDTTDTSDA